VYLRALTLVLATILVVTTSAHSQEQNVYPEGIGWVNVKERYGAKGDGVTDDTEAIRAALSNRNEPYLDRVSLYFPDGVYLVSDTLVYASDYYDCCVSIQGQSREGTIIKLRDSCPGYTDPFTQRPVLYTRSGNQSFHQNIRNITVDVGSGNPGAVAIDYIANNTGVIRDVTIRAAEGSGHTGISMGRAWPGPALISNVSIDGFDVGISIVYTEYSMTFENIQCANQRSIAFANHGNIVAVRNMSVYDVPLVYVQSGGVGVFLDCDFMTATSEEVAMEIRSGVFYARSISSAGYRVTVATVDTLTFGPIDEFLHGQRFTLWPSAGLSLRLPIKETPPAYVNNDMSAWASVADYGAEASDPLFFKRIDNDAIQTAFNAGKPVVWLPITRSNGSCFGISRPITVPEHVRLITGFDQSKFCYFDSATLVVTGNGPEPLFIERMDGVRIHHVGKRPVVLRDLVLYDYTNVAGAGDVFIENITGAFRPQHATNMWARQYNPEVQPFTEAQHENHGGRHWILGMKTEGFAQMTRTTSGGATEVLGGLTYPAQSHPEDVRPVAWNVDNAYLSVIHGFASYVPRGMYPVVVRETRGTETRELLLGSLPWTHLPLFTTGRLTSTVANEQRNSEWTVQRDADGRLLPQNGVTILSVHDVLGRAWNVTNAPFPAVVTCIVDGRIQRIVR
jgi:hypothetical protein